MTIDLFNAALAAAPDELEYLLRVYAPEPGTLDDRAALAAADLVFQAIQPMPDLGLRELYLGRACAHLGLAKALLIRRFKTYDEKIVGTKSAPAAPAGQGKTAATEHMGDDRRSRVPSNAYHARLMDELRHWISAQGITPDAVGGWLKAGSEEPAAVNNKRLVLTFLLKFRETEGISRTYVEETLEAIILDARAQRRAALIGRHTGKPATLEGAETLRAWLRATTGEERPGDLVVMRHWIWSIKRLATGRRTEQDIMPILWGGQGDGKSISTERLSGPWHELVTSITAENLTDERKLALLSTCVIGRWEEMQGASRADVAALKHTISHPTVDYRQLHTNLHERELRTCGFIGTSNDPVDQLIADHSGMRRFFQVDTRPTDRDLINRLDYGVLWQCVSESDPAPINEMLGEIRVLQQQLVHKDAVRLWLEAESWDRMTVLDLNAPADGHGGNRIAIEPYSPTRGEAFEHLAARFRSWCARVGQAPIGAPKFAARIHQEGFTKSRPRADGRVWKYFRPVPPQPPAPEAPTGPSRGAKIEAEPDAGEDRFVSSPSAPAPAPTLTLEQLAAEEARIQEQQAIEDALDNGGPFG